MLEIDVHKPIDKNICLCSQDEDYIFSLEGLRSIIESPENENQQDIRLNIHCDGGSVSEGLAIYDYLRLSGKNIFCNIEGDCHSMALVLLLSAPAENRTANPNCSALIHEVRQGYFGEITEKEAQRIAEELRQWKDKILDIYALRTGKDKEVLRSLMEEEKIRSADFLLEYGFISKINSYITNRKPQNDKKQALKDEKQVLNTAKQISEKEKEISNTQKQTGFAQKKKTDKESQNKDTQKAFDLKESQDKEPQQRIIANQDEEKETKENIIISKENANLSLNKTLNEMKQLLKMATDFLISRSPKNKPMNYVFKDVDEQELFATEASTDELLIGMQAQPDGIFTLVNDTLDYPAKTVVTVKDGVIIDIVPYAPEGEEKQETSKETEAENSLNEPKDNEDKQETKPNKEEQEEKSNTDEERIKELEKENKELSDKVKELDEKIKELLDSLKEKEEKIAVAKNLVSGYVVEQRRTLQRLPQEQELSLKEKVYQNRKQTKK